MTIDPIPAAARLREGLLALEASGDPTDAAGALVEVRRLRAWLALGRRRALGDDMDWLERHLLGVVDALRRVQSATDAGRREAGQQAAERAFDRLLAAVATPRAEGLTEALGLLPGARRRSLQREGTGLLGAALAAAEALRAQPGSDPRRRRLEQHAHLAAPTLEWLGLAATAWRRLEAALETERALAGEVDPRERTSDAATPSRREHALRRNGAEATLVRDFETLAEEVRAWTSG